MRLALFALIALATLAASCAVAPMTTPAGPSYSLTVYTVRGADLFARTADFGMSADDCAKASRHYPLSSCDAENKSENVEKSA